MKPKISAGSLCCGSAEAVLDSREDPLSGLEALRARLASAPTHPAVCLRRPVVRLPYLPPHAHVSLPLRDPDPMITVMITIMIIVIIIIIVIIMIILYIY
jgi:hypothetical protein